MSASVDPAASAAFFSETGRARIPAAVAVSLGRPKASSHTAREVESARARERGPQLCDGVEASARAAGRTSDTVEGVRVSLRVSVSAPSALTVCGRVDGSP